MEGACQKADEERNCSSHLGKMTLLLEKSKAKAEVSSNGNS
jgi:hypothetical protein